MNRRERWRKVLDREVRRWSEMPYDEVLSMLDQQHVYVVDLDSKPYQVEVETLERTPEHVHLMICVDDGTLPASIVPVSDTLIRHRTALRTPQEA
jgi:REP element-mobilizing transposase RayT